MYFFFSLDRFTWSHMLRTKPLDSIKLSSAMWTKLCEELSRVFLFSFLVIHDLAAYDLSCIPGDLFKCGLKRGANPTHHQHHGCLTLGRGVGSCSTTNLRATASSYPHHQHPHQHHGGLTLVSGLDVGAADSCLLLNDLQFTGNSILETTSPISQRSESDLTLVSGHDALKCQISKL